MTTQLKHLLLEAKKESLAYIKHNDIAYYLDLVDSDVKYTWQDIVADDNWNYKQAQKDYKNIVKKDGKLFDTFIKDIDIDNKDKMKSMLYRMEQIGFIVQTIAEKYWGEWSSEHALYEDYEHIGVPVVHLLKIGSWEEFQQYTTEMRAWHTFMIAIDYIIDELKDILKR